MKVGSEDRKKLAWMAGLLVVGLLLFSRNILMRPSGNPPDPARTEERRAKLQQQRGPRRRIAGVNLQATLDPTLRTDLLKASEEHRYAGSGRNIFRGEPAQPEIPKPEPQNIPKVADVAPQPTGPPPPPPINLKFFGFASRPGEPKRIFLSEGEEVFIAAEGEIINRRYKIVRIGANSVEVEDVLNNSRQSIPLTQG